MRYRICDIRYRIFDNDTRLYFYVFLNILINDYDKIVTEVINMYDIRKGDVIVTIDGHVLQVTKESTNFLYGRDYTDDTNFMTDRREIEKRVKEVHYV